MKGAFYTGEYRNVFKELGYSEDEIRKKIDDAYQTIFYGSEDERFYHEIETIWHILRIPVIMMRTGRYSWNDDVCSK